MRPADFSESTPSIAARHPSPPRSVRRSPLLASLLSVALLSIACSGSGSQTVDSTFTSAGADAAYQNGVRAHNAGDLAAAETHLRQALSINPRFLAAHLELGEVLLEGGRDNAALEVFDQAIALRDQSGEAYSGRAAALLELGRYDEAAQAAEAAIQRGQVEDSTVVLAMSFERSGQPDRAVELLQSVLRDFPGRTDVRLELSRLYVESDRQSEAVPVLERAVRIDTSDVVAWRALAELYQVLQDWDRSVEAWQRVADLSPGDGYARTRLGEAHLKDGNPRLAIQALDEAIALDPRIADAYVFRGQAQYARGFLERAQDNAESALSISPDHLEALALLASVYERQGDLANAVEAYTRAVNGHPDALEPAMALAELHLQLDQPEQAVRVLQPFEESVTDEDFRELIMSAYVAVGQNDRVLQQLVELVEAHPNEHERLLSLVQVALATPGQTVISPSELLSYAERGVELTGGYRIEYRIALIDALAFAGERERALREAQRAMDDLPNSPEIRERLDSLRR